MKFVSYLRFISIYNRSYIFIFYKKHINSLIFLVVALLFVSPIHAFELSGVVGLENLGFLEAPLNNQQHSNYLSGVIEPKLTHEWDDSKQMFTFEPFYRYSQYDNRRTHFDIRELNWLNISDTWELRVGISRVFWGTAESEHLVNIVNQTDLVEDLTMEEKLGQPMVNLSLIRDWGTLNLFVLPGFRERTFSGSQGRFNFNPPLDVENSQFGAQGFKKETSYATRWSKSLGDWDLGLSHFYGTSREPSIIPSTNSTGGLNFVPQYPIIHQGGLDLQVTKERWLWKLESIIRSGQGPSYNASVGGLEYSFYGVFDSKVDVGLITEYMYDSRGTRAITLLNQPNQLIFFQDDFMTGVRVNFNDEQSSEALASGTFDRTTGEKFYGLTIKRRLVDNIKMLFEMRFYNNNASINDATYFLRRDNYIRSELNYYF